MWLPTNPEAPVMSIVSFAVYSAPIAVSFLVNVKKFLFVPTSCRSAKLPKFVESNALIVDKSTVYLQKKAQPLLQGCAFVWIPYDYCFYYCQFIVCGTITLWDGMPLRSDACSKALQMCSL